MRAVDLCAGSGWAVACQWLGISELGFEIMPEAIGTRDAMGALTQMTDRDGKIVGVPMEDIPDAFCSMADIQIAGPPCQTFSSAGKGEGRKALTEVLRRVELFGRTGEFTRGGAGDPRTWLVLEPLRLAVHGLPRYIVWEQVRPVLPVWEACGRVLGQFGYSTWTGILSAEQYGVPQTRKRAFLIARRDGKVAGPPPVTHSRYHERDPQRMDEGVLPWVSMAKALGWGTTGRPSFTVTGGGSNTGGAEPYGRRARETLLEYRASALQNATVRGEDQPVPTVMFGHAEVRWVQRSNYSSGGNGVPSPIPGSPPLGKRELHEPSATITSKVGKWVHIRPATTVLGDPRIAHPGHRDRSGGEAQFSPTQSIRVTVAEAATLQTFPAGHPFQGTSGKQYLQIGNAVPPLLAWHILRTFGVT